MMKFTNHADLTATAERLGLSGWYASDASGDYLGILRSDDEEWYVGFTPTSDVLFPISLDMVPK